MSIKPLTPRRLTNRIVFTALLLIPLFGLSGCSGDDTKDAPALAENPLGWTNVIVYIIDTLRADHVGSYGYDPENSPNIDRIGEEGAIFARTYAQAPWTKASSASILTSTYPTVHGADTKFTGKLRPEVETLAEVMKANGYATCAYAANVWVDPKWGFGQGFDEYYMMGKLLKKWDIDPPIRASHINRGAFRFIEKHKDEPFFLYLHSIDVHDPYRPMSPFNEIDPAYTGEIDGSGPQMKRLEGNRKKLPEEDLNHLIALYDGEIRYNDFQIGRLMERLKAVGLDASTLVLVTSDHGEEFHEHGGYRHGKHLYEYMVRIPWVMRCPSLIAPGARVESIAQSIDMMPTVLDLLDLEIPPGAQGKSLVPLIEGDAGSINDAAFIERSIAMGGSKVQHVFVSVVGDRYKLIDYPAGMHRLFNRHGYEHEFFDLRSDPVEKQNLSEEKPELLAKYAGRLAAWVDRQKLRATEGPRETIAVEKEMEDELRALGYID